MIKKFEFSGMEQRLNAVLENFIQAKSDRMTLFTETNLSLKATLSEMFGGCALWGIKRNEYFSGKVKEYAQEITSYPQLIDLARKWDKEYNFHTLMYLLFSQGLLSHIDHDEMRDSTRKLDEIFELFTKEEYIPRKDADATEKEARIATDEEIKATVTANKEILDQEIERATTKDNELATAIAEEKQAREAKDAELENKIEIGSSMLG